MKEYTSSYTTKTTVIHANQQAMYAAAPRAQLRPDPGTPGASGLGNFATLCAVRRGRKKTERNEHSRKQDKYSVEVEERLQWNVAKDEKREQIVRETHLPGRIP